MTATGDECTGCGHVNTPDARFCSGCGTELVRRCSACTAVQPLDARFCNQCGSPLTDRTITSSASDPTSEEGASRKEVTLLFADLVGSTAFGEHVDPEAARATMSRFFEIIRRSIEVHDGSVAKFMGDGVMAVFGIPEVAEDDAHRAVLAGLEIQQQFGAFADMVRRRHGATLGLRIGINTGEIVIADGDDDMIGDAINTAARIEAACTPGRVLVGEPTWRLTRSSIRYRDHGDVEAKGKSEPLATFEVESTRADTADDTPFVGRAGELAQIQAAAGRVTAERRVRLVSVVGPPGVGKTRLARELVLEGDARTFDVRIERRQSTSFAPIADLIRQAIGIPDGLDPDDEHAAIEPLVGEQPDAEQLASSLAAVLGGGGGLSTEQLFTTVRRLLEVIGGDGPITIVFDDVQWAEPLFWDLLDHLVEWTAGVPVLLVVLARPELRDLRPALCQSGRTVERSITLEGLDPDETEQLAARLLRAESIPAELVGRLPASTDGNPLFVREFVQMLVDDGVLERDGERGWRLTIEADAIEIPPTIQSLLASRIERLDHDQRQVVEFASVIGTEFDRGVLVALAGPGSGPAIRRTLDSLQHMELITATGLWSGDEPVYRFHHVLIRDAAYRRMLKGRRAELHLAAAAWIGDHAPGGADEIDVTVGYHLERAHRYRVELSQDDDDTIRIGRRAADLLGGAAQRALARDDLQAAGGLVVRALDCIGSDDPHLPELLLVGCEALLSTGDVTRGAELVAMLESIDGDERLDAWTTCFRSQLITLTEPDALDRAGADADAAAQRLDELDDQAGVAKARIVRASALARLGRIGDCEAELDLALTAARAADDRRNVTAVLGAAPVAALWGPSPVARAGGRCLDVLRLLRITSASPAVEATSIRCQAVLEALRGRYDSARTMLATAGRICEEHGIRQGLLETTFYAGLVELFAGEPAAAEQHLRRAHDEMGQLGLGADAGQAAGHLARALLRQGRVDEADQMARRGEELAGRNPQTGIVARAVRAEVLSAQGRHDEAIALADEAVAVASVTDILVDHANALRSLARVHAAAGNSDQARTSNAAADAMYEAKGAISCVLGRTEADVRAGDGPAAEAFRTKDGTGSLDRRRHGLENRATATDQRLCDLIVGGDRETILELHAPSARLFDHRTLTGIDLMGRDEMVASLRQVMAGLTSYDVRTLDIRGDDLSLTERTVTYGSSAVSVLEIIRVDPDGRVDFVEIFEPTELEAATRRLDDLASAESGVDAGPATPALQHRADANGIPANRATQATESSIDAMLSHDFDALAELYAVDVTTQDHRPLTGLDLVGHERHLDNLREVARGLRWADSTRLAIRGNRLCLHAGRNRFGDSEVSFHQLTRVDGHGRIDRVEIFGEEDLDTARRRLDELFDAALANAAPNRARRVLMSCLAALERNDAETAGSMYAPDADVTDHRRIVGRSYDETSLADAIRPLAHGLEEVESTLLATHADDLCLSTIRYIHPLGEFVMLEITRINADGLIDLSELFDHDDADAARTRFDELTAGHDRQLRSFSSSDDEHMRMRTLELVNTATMAEERDRGRCDTVAVRLDDLALIRRDDRLVIIRSDDHAVVHDVEAFESDQLPEADHRLDLLGLDELPELQRRQFRSGVDRMRDFNETGDVERIMPPDAAYVDHRPLGWGTASYRERANTLDGVARLVQTTTKLLAVRDGRLCILVHQASTTNDGFENSTESIYVMDYDSGEEPAPIAVHQFAPDQLDDALAFFDDEPIAGGKDRSDTFAYRQADELAALFETRDQERYLHRLAPGFTHSDRRSGAHVELGSDGQLASNLEIYQVDGLRFDRTHLAHRGARVCAHLCTISDERGYGLEFIHVSEFSLDGLLRRAIIIDPEPDLAEQVLDELIADELRSLDLVNTATMAEQRGQGACDVLAVRLDDLALIRRGEQFVIIRSDDQAVVHDVATFDDDQIADAEHQLDLLMLDEVPTPLANQVRPTLERVHEFNTTGEPLHLTTAPDSPNVDHRPLGLGTLTLGDRAESLRNVANIRHFTAKLIALRDRRSCALTRDTSLLDTGLETSTDSIYVIDFGEENEPGITAVHQFSTDQLEEALHFFDNEEIGHRSGPT